MADTIVYEVAGMSCDHCVRAVEGELAAVHGVESASADLGTRLVTVTGGGLDDGALRAAIERAGYEVVR